MVKGDLWVVVMLMTARKLPLTLLLMMVIVSAVSFLPVQEAKALTVLAYDNGIEGGNAHGPYYYGVRFSLPPGIASARLVTVRYSVEFPGTLTVYITGADHVTLLTNPIATSTSSVYPAFTDLDVSGLNIVVSGDFYIAVLLSYDLSVAALAFDTGPVVGRSFYGDSLSTMTTPTEWYNWMIRAVIDPFVPAPVGGVTLPTNKLEILTPYLALAGLVAALSAVVVVKRRR